MARTVASGEDLCKQVPHQWSVSPLTKGLPQQGQQGLFVTVTAARQR
jgi:hypothetical protein